MIPLRLYALGGALVVFIALSVWIHSLRSDKEKLTADLAAQTQLTQVANANFNNCIKQKEAADEASSEYQDNLAKLNSKLSAYRLRERSAKCVPIRKAEPGPITKMPG